MGWEFFCCSVKNIADVNKTKYSRYADCNAKRMTGVALTSSEAYSNIADKDTKGEPFFKAHYPDSAMTLAANSFTKKLNIRIASLLEEANDLRFAALEFVTKTKTKTCKNCGARISTEHYKKIASNVALRKPKTIGWVVSCTNCKDDDGIASVSHVKKRIALINRRLELETTLRAEQERLLEKLLERKKIQIEYVYGVWLHESDAAEINGDDGYDD